MALILRERIFVTEQYFAHKSYKTVSEMFQAKFPGKDVPNKSTMSHIITKFCRPLTTVAAWRIVNGY